VTAAALHEHELGLTWVSADALARASHALADGGRTWLVDPFDDDAALERAAALGEPAAVVQLFENHNRDCAAIAARLGVPHLRTPEAIPDAPFEAIPVLSRPGWRETALWWPQRRGLVVAEMVGTARHYAIGRGEAGIHPMMRLRPAGELRAHRPEHLLVGHGPPLHGEAATAALDEAYASSRRDMPRMLAAAPALARATLARFGR
jgi:hypothetical protein